jgi:hypothetical protein
MNNPLTPYLITLQLFMILPVVMKSETQHHARGAYFERLWSISYSNIFLILSFHTYQYVYEKSTKDSKVSGYVWKTRVRYGVGTGTVFFVNKFRRALGRTQPPINWRSHWGGGLGAHWRQTEQDRPRRIRPPEIRISQRMQLSACKLNGMAHHYGRLNDW